MLDDLMGRVLTAFERLPQFLRLNIVLEGTPDPHARELFAEFSAHTNSTFLEPLADLAPEDAEAVNDVVKAVLWSVLRAWAMGSMTMTEARRRMGRAIELIFSPPPKPQPRRSG